MASFTPVFCRPASSSVTGLSVLIASVVVVAAATSVLFFQVRGVRQESARLERALVAEISGFREAASAVNAGTRKELDSLVQQVQLAKARASSAASLAKLEAQKRADELAGQIEQERIRHQEEVTGELTSARAVAVAANARIGEISSDVGSVKAEVALTRSALDSTAMDLRRAIGDMGVLSGQIATNANELAALRRLGERDYIEFQLTKTRQPQKLGEVSIVLKKADAKRNRYTVELIADDRLIEKKDKTTNEPVQFYVPGVRIPYELVVNQVGKDRISGYLSAPKVRQMAQKRTAGGGGAQTVLESTARP